MHRIDHATAAPGDLFTEGNPATATPATTVTADWLNAIQEEVAAVIDAAGITLDKEDNTQLTQAIAALIAASIPESGMHGQCVLERSGADLVLKPVNGNKLIVNGAVETVPAAGVTLSAAGLTPDTTYYIYAYINTGAMTLEASATGHSTDATTGVEIKTGDATRTLVGMARTITGPAWQDAAAQRFVRSWFNRGATGGSNAFAADRTTTSTSYVEMSSTERVSFLTFAGETVRLQTSGKMQSSYSGYDIMYGSIGIDSATPEDCVCIGDDTSASGSTPLSVSLVKSGLAEGYHYATILAKKTQSSTLTLLGAASGPDRCTINFSIH